jgi:hypothetical protein
MYGPLEYLVIEFPGNKFNGKIAPELAKLVDKGFIRVIDLMVILKDADGKVTGVELADAGDDVVAAFGPILKNMAGLISMADVDKVGAILENNSSAGMLLFEHLWPIAFKEAVVSSGGRLVADARVAPEDVLATMAEIAELGAF